MSIWSLSLKVLTLNSTEPLSLTVAVPVPCAATPAKKLSFTFILSFLIPRLTFLLLSISVMVSPTAILLPPAMLLRLISVLARSLSAPSVGENLK